MGRDFYSSNNSDSSISQAKIRQEDLAAAQEIDKIIKAANKFVRKAASQNQSYEQINQEANIKLDGLLLEIESYVEENDSSDDEGVLQAISEIIKNFFDALGIPVEWQNLKLKFLKEEKDKNWLASIIKALCDKLRKVFSQIFKRNLNWDEALADEIKKLEEKLASGGLSEADMAEVLERLEALRAMKLKFQMALALLTLTSFFTLLEFVAQAQEISTEEDKTTEAVSSKEPEVKQAGENVKVAESELKPVMRDVIPARDTEVQNLKEDTGKRPVIQDKPEFDHLNLLLGSVLIGNMLEQMKPSEQKPEVQKPKETAVTAPPHQPAAAASVKVPEVKPVRFISAAATRSCKKKEGLGGPKVASNKTTGCVLKEKTQITKSTNEGKMDSIYDDFLTQFTCAKEKNPNMNEQNVSKAKSMNEKVRSELGEINKVENVNCGRSM